ncbi:Hypothetical protein GbCGDNIH1_1631 [Granulibacter bethesdensis CGDNIH1]|uniref:Uncharacterized protein n=1 Tax=Granulibacter bethesdensis (strain ATCC BAA-1260 / CGDNIH1) TaxID=391165 RepID=Q0BRM3_GRABC|nr:Hypothetical protein GbCGDNIH1_1631 [Granulibacter bethesdensis CGDNIH1]APH65141.1 Hypothetical protein GbCGDNIH1I4_8031 [Granulibacter bethesdensis]
MSSRHGLGSISAHAEEPGRGRKSKNVHRVYLRARGGTSRGLLSENPAGGLSPRTRRNLISSRI